MGKEINSFCGFCNKEVTTRISNCGRYKAVKYRDRICQKKHWKSHKTVCCQPAAAASTTNHDSTTTEKGNSTPEKIFELGKPQQQHNETVLIPTSTETTTQSQENEQMGKKEKINFVYCENCFQEEKTEGRFKPCSRCKLVKYCGNDCQSAHWKSTHNKLCIPVEEFKVLEDPHYNGGGDEIDRGMIPCAICLEQVSADTDCVLPCKHIYHVKCISTLRATNSVQQVCPLCRTNLPPGPQDSYNTAYLILVESNWELYPAQRKGAKAIELLLNAASEGHLRATLLLATIFHHGYHYHDILVDERAVEWAQKAAALGTFSLSGLNWFKIELDGSIC